MANKGNKPVRKYTFFIVLFLLACCHRIVWHDTDELIYSKKMSPNIFEQKYQSFSGGVLVSDTYSYYLTDSITFREFVGNCDDKEVFRFNAIGVDTVRAVKWSWRNRFGDLPEIPIDSFFYSVKELKKENSFE